MEIHRRTGYFFPGGGGKPFAQKIFALFPKFLQNSRTETKPMQQDRPYWHMKMAPYSFSGLIPAKFEHKLRRHKQTFWKITTTVVLDKDENFTVEYKRLWQAYTDSPSELW